MFIIALMHTWKISHIKAWFVIADGSFSMRKMGLKQSNTCVFGLGMML